MVSNLWRSCIVVGCVVLGTYAGPASSQDLRRPSTIMLVRQQFSSIAREVVDTLQLAAECKVLLSVQPSPRTDVAENAFADALMHKGYQTFLLPGHDSGSVRLNINVLSEGARFREIGRSMYVRTVQTAVEARVERPNGEAVEVLGLFQRIASDTVSAPDAEVSLQRPERGTEAEATIFERLIGPLIILASGIMVVYLFFTVRS